jgi:hypothetical protein
MDNEKKSVVEEVKERNYNPFGQNVVERSYTRPQVGVNAEALAQPIPEPTYQAQQLGGGNPYDNLSGDGGFAGGNMGGGGGGGSRKEADKPVNPSMGDLPPHERRQAAEHLADMAIAGYEMLHVFGNRALQVSKSKIRKLVAKEVIDLSIQIPFGTGTITAEQFIAQYNDEVSDALSVSNKFKKDVRPPLIRVLEKRGIGATDEQQLLTIVIMDLVVKGGVIYQALGTQKEMIKVIQDRTQFERENGYGATPTPPPQTKKTTPTPPKSTPKNSFVGEEDHDAEDFNFRSNESVMNSSVHQMKIPKTGKDRSMEQRYKEKVWERNAKMAEGSTYAEAMQNKKNAGGKRGRPKKSEVNTQKIAEAIVIKERDSQDNDGLDNSLE